jgi:hypothetical protein
MQPRWQLTAASFWKLAAVSLIVLLAGVTARPAGAAGTWGAETQPATNVLDNVVDLQGVISLNTRVSGQYWFEYQRDVTPRGTWQRAATRSFSSGGDLLPVQISVTERLRPDCSEIEEACSVATLTPTTTWIYRLCAQLTGSTAVKCFDAGGKAGGNNFDGFQLLEAWDDPSDATLDCPVTVPDGTGFSCYQPEAATTLSSQTPFSRHYTNTAHYGIGRVEIGTFQHGRDLNFNGSVAQIWQSGNVFTGPALRYDFRMTIYRGLGHDTPVDSFRDIEPEGSFSSGNTLSHVWFVKHHTNGPYHVHWRVIFRASGVNNPSRSDGTFISPVTSTPYYRCELDADGARICRFPD